MNFFQKRQISIRWSLLRNLLLLICVTSGAILGINIYYTHTLMQRLAYALMKKTMSQTETRLQQFFNPIQKQLQIVREWGLSEAATMQDAQELNNLFVPLLEQYPQISAAILASSEGREWILLKKNNQWVTRETHIKRWGKKKFWTSWENAQTPFKEWWEESEYDPRTRPWFEGASQTKNEGEIFWTPPYTFFTLKEPGITASIRWTSPKDPNIVYVAGFDVLLLAISQFTTNLQVSEQGQVLIFNEEGKVLGLPRSPKFQTPEALKSSILLPVEELHLPQIQETVHRWKTLRSKTLEPVYVRFEGWSWWSEFLPFPLENRTFWIGVLIPESDLLEGLMQQRNAILLIAFSALGFAVLIAILLARNYSRPLEQLAEQSHRIQNLELDASFAIHSDLKEISHLVRAHEQMLYALQSFSRYVPIDVVRELLKRGEIAKIGGKTETLTILFTDIQGFTAIVEKMPPEKITRQMAEYFEAMLDLLQSQHATIDKFVGDAIVAFWGAPNPDPYHAQHAVHAILSCSQRLIELNQQWEKQGFPALWTRFGLDTGAVVVGNVGAHSRLSYTVLGDTANLASRLEGLNRVYGTKMLVSEHTYQIAKESFLWRCLDLVRVKGRQHAVRIYEPLGFPNTTSVERIAFARAYEEAFSLYQSRAFLDAIEKLFELQKKYPEDISVLRLLKICQHYLHIAPPENWDGVSQIAEK